MRISIKLNTDAEMDPVSSFTSKQQFRKSPLWNFVEERNLGGVLKVTYAPTYYNEFIFENFEEMRVAYETGTESALANEFTKQKV